MGEGVVDVEAEPVLFVVDQGDAVGFGPLRWQRGQAGVGPGAGFAVGNAMAGALGNAANQQATGAGSASAATIKCPKCGAATPSSSKFCNECGAKIEVAAAAASCIKCGAALHPGAKFCSECGSSQEKAKCSNCQAELPAGAKFCKECGTKAG